MKTFFRLFDIWKPSIIGRIDRDVKGGWGVNTTRVDLAGGPQISIDLDSLDVGNIGNLRISAQAELVITANGVVATGSQRNLDELDISIVSSVITSFKQLK